jgi:hypothetical protein
VLAWRRRSAIAWLIQPLGRDRRPRFWPKRTLAAAWPATWVTSTPLSPRNITISARQLPGTQNFPVVAARLITNGVYLLSVVSARTFGWIGFGDTLTRLRSTLATFERLQKHRGHLLNGYDAAALPPRSMCRRSTVDNLAGHLVTLSLRLRALGGSNMCISTPAWGLHDVAALCLLKGLPGCLG